MLVNAVTQLTLPQQSSFSVRPSHSVSRRVPRVQPGTRVPDLEKSRNLPVHSDLTDRDMAPHPNIGGTGTACRAFAEKEKEVDRIEKPPGRKSEFANQGEIANTDPAENDTVTGREDHLGLAAAVAGSGLTGPSAPNQGAKSPDDTIPAAVGMRRWTA